MAAKIILPLLLLFLLLGCYHDNEEELVPCSTETEHLHFSPHITSIFTHNTCYSCHQGAAPEGGINLEDYGTVKMLVDNGRLVGAITHATGFAPMPQGGPKMSDCDISRVKAWIDAGAPNH